MRAKATPSRTTPSSPLLPWWLRPWQNRYRRWLDRRIPPARVVTLTQKNLFIFPSAQGFGYLLLALLVWIGATNFQNNLVLALCFFLLAILFIAIHQTFANLSGLTIRFVSAKPVFAGEIAHCTLVLEAAGDRQQLELQWPGEFPITVSPNAGEPTRIELPITCQQRGRYRPGRFRLQSRYPLGIIRCWTWLDLDAEILVYPQPMESRLTPYRGSHQNAQGEPVAGAEDFHALRHYIPGDSLARVAWKHYAAGRGLQVRENVDLLNNSEPWLDFHALTDADPEDRLSRLCFIALEISADQRTFGLRLPNRVIEPSAGHQHLQAVLRALAECPV